jgi:hypothetical protein
LFSTGIEQFKILLTKRIPNMYLLLICSVASKDLVAIRPSGEVPAPLSEVIVSGDEVLTSDSRDVGAAVDDRKHVASLMSTRAFLYSESTAGFQSAAIAPSPRDHLIVCAGLFILVVVLSISAIMVGDEASHVGKRGQKLRVGSKMFGEGEHGVLVPSLVVPRGKEFLFALKSAVTGQRQTERFSMVDPDNKPFCSVLLSEDGPPNPSAFHNMYGILLETQSGETLAFLNTEDFNRDGKTVCPIHRKDGDLFGHLTRDRDPPVRYNIIAPHTGDVLLSFHGDFAEQAVNVHNGHGQLVATTERHAFSFALDRYVQVRVAPCVDASLVMLGLLGIAKMESD